MSELDKLEGHNNQVRTELEIHIASIQKAIAKYDQDYASNLDVISSISDTLLLLLSLVSRYEYVIIMCNVYHATFLKTGGFG